MIHELLTLPVESDAPGIFGTLKRKLTLLQPEIVSGITICTGSPIPIIFQSHENELFHFHGLGIIVPPVAALRILPVYVWGSFTGTIFHGASLVMVHSMSCSSMSPVAIVYACADLSIPPLIFQRFNTLSRKLVVIIVIRITITSPIIRAEPRCD